MGHIEVDVGIGRSEEAKLVKKKALVDTGATFTVIPEKVARELNLTLVGEKEKVSTAKGFDELDLAHALLEIDGKRRIMPVLVSRHVDRVLLGVTTLEAMQLRLNPITGKLEEHTPYSISNCKNSARNQLIERRHKWCLGIKVNCEVQINRGRLSSRKLPDFLRGRMEESM